MLLGIFANQIHHIDGFTNTQIHSQARQRIDVACCHAFLHLKEINGFLQRDLGRFVESRADAHRKIVGGGSTRGSLILLPLCKMNCSVGASEISIAPPSTSPSPWTAWPSPVKNWAPLLNIGRYKVEPLARNFRSILPPHAPGGVEDTMPRLVGGDTAMMPMNGFSGISISSENNATRRSKSIRINFADCSVSSFGNTPLPGPVLFTP